MSDRDGAGVDEIAAIKAEIKKRGLTHVTVAHVDTNGTLRGKLVAADSFVGALAGGSGLPSIFMAVDYNEAVVANLALSDPKTGYQNASTWIDPGSMRDFPQGSGRDDLLFLMQFDDDHAQTCPRSVLTSALEKCGRLGWEINSAYEYEFSVLNETAVSVAAKGADMLEPFEDSPIFGSIIQQGCNAQFYCELTETAERMGFPLDALHKELGPGLLEVALKPGVGVRNADNAMLFKTMAKTLAKRQGMLATFMAKLKTSLQGHGAHVHLSLRGAKDGKPLFYDPDGTYGGSDLLLHFIGGLQRYLPEFTLMALPNVNSYKRVIPDAWAPVYPNWGYENRTCAFRVVGGSASSKRVEIRLAGADANPYLALAAFVTAGRLGVENEIKPTDACTLNGWAGSEASLKRFPSTLSEAIEAFSTSEAAASAFGAGFVEHFAGMKQAQNDEFLKSVTDWEIRNLLVSS